MAHLAQFNCHQCSPSHDNPFGKKVTNHSFSNAWSIKFEQALFIIQNHNLDGIDNKIAFSNAAFSSNQSCVAAIHICMPYVEPILAVLKIGEQNRNRYVSKRKASQNFLESSSYSHNID